MTTTEAGPTRRPFAGTGSAGRHPMWAFSLVVADRRGAMRLLVMALGIGLCAFVLLGLTTISPAIDRMAARADAGTPTGDGPGISFRWSYTTFESDAGRVTGLDLDGPANAATPPGVTVFPGNGELVVSPALADLLASPAGTGVRALLPGTVVGTIDPAALAGPDDLYFYAGTALDPGESEATGWGLPNGQHPLDPRIWMVLVTGTVIIAVPLLLFIALAARLGGARRDRRTAVLRLLGATRGQLRILGATEALLASALGLALAAAGYLAIRPWVASLQFDGRGMQRTDLTPTLPALILIVVGVPGLAMTATLLSTHRVTHGDDATTRNRAQPVRAWWRIALGAAAILAACWMIWQRNPWSYVNDLRGTALLCLVVALTLFAVAAITGLVVDRLARASGEGSVPYLLARRRIAQDGAVATRPAAALATVLAGSIALIAILLPMRQQDSARTAGPPEFYGYVTLSGPAEWVRLDESLRSTDAVQHSSIGGDLAWGDATDTSVVGPTLMIATCAALHWAAPGTACRDGDTFQFARSDGSHLKPPPYQLNRADGAVQTWSPPAGSHLLGAGEFDPACEAFPYGGPPDFLLTPAAAARQFPDYPWNGITTTVMVVEQARIGDVQQAVAWLGERATGMFDHNSTRGTAKSLVPWASVALIACGVGTLVIAGLGQWLAAAQQIGDRRRAFALARASGVPVRTLRHSMVAGWTLPAAVGLLVAAVVGMALGATLRYVRGDPLTDLPWGWTALCCGVALAVTLALAYGSALRLKATTGPEAMRTE